MKPLILFELRKIIKKPAAVVAILGIFFLSFLLAFSTFHNMYAFDGKHAEGAGKKAVQIDKEVARKYEGILTDEKVQRIMKEYHPVHDLRGMNAKYLYNNALQSAVFYRFSDMDGNWNGTTVAEVFGNQEIKVGYINGWLSMEKGMAKVFIFLDFVLMFLLAPVFSGEYGGMDQILFTSRYGKTKCAAAKVTASILVALFLTFLTVGWNLLLGLFFYGTEGLDCSILLAPLEFSEGYIPFPLTCGTVLAYQILLAFLGSVSVAGITLMISTLCKNQMFTLASSAVVYLLPLMLPVSESSPLYRLVVLMPMYYAQYISLMSVDQMENGLLYAIWAIPMAMAFLGMGAFLSPKIFARHEVF